jgi:Hint domain
MAVQPPPLQQDQPPVVNVSAQNGVEDTDLAITNVSVTDPDAGNSDISLTLSVADGTLDVQTDVAGGVTAAQVTNDGTGTVTITASQSAIDATLAATDGLIYAPDLNFNGPDTLTATANDLHHNGLPPFPGDVVASATITIQPVNDSPVLAHAGPSLSMHGFSVLDPNLTVSDVDLDARNNSAGNYAGASFSIERQGGGSPDDGFYIDNSSGITVGANNVLQINGQTFATASVANNFLTISFTSSGTIATSALVNNLLQHIGYENSNVGSVTLDYTFNDGSPGGGQGSGAPATATASIQVTNIGPIFAHETSSVYAPPNVGAVLEPGLTVSDTPLDTLNGGAGNYDGATFTIERDGGGNPDDTYFLDNNSGGISLSGSNIEINGQTVATAGASGGVLEVDFNSSATTADVDDVMEHLRYANTSATPPDSVTLDYTFDDGSVSATGSVEAFVGIACYCTGTLILTDDREVPVETLQIGDRVITASGVARPIKWIGKRSYGGRFIVGRKDILPICFKTGSLGNGVPKRDLWISPHHAMYLQGVLIEARDLVNDLTVTQAERIDEVAYFHIELESHDVIIAEGALSETFVDDDSRGMFNNAHEYKGLYPDSAVAEARYCAPRVRDGYGIEAARQAIHARAGRHASRVSTPTLRGHIDEMGAGRIAGWAQNPDHPDMPVCLDILADGQLIGQVLANRYRADLETAGLGSGRHAFEFTPPRGLHLSADAVEVRRSFDGELLPVPRAA